MIAAHLSVVAFPSDGASVGRWVRRAIQVLSQSGLRHEVHAMGTEIECERLEDLLRVVSRIDAALVAEGAQRVTIQLKIDDRRDVSRTLAQKVASVRGEARSTTGSQTT